MHAGAVTRITQCVLAFCRGRSAPLFAAWLVAACGSSSSSLTSVEPPAKGALAVTVGGLPVGLAAAVTVTGPDNYSKFIQASADLTQLVPGTYTVAAAEVSEGQATYGASPASQTSQVVGGGTGTVSVAYSAKPVPPAGGLNLSIAGAYLIQAAQRFDGSVPLIAGRDAYLRVFAVANASNQAQAQVRVRLYHGAALVLTETISGPAAGVPLAPNEASLTGSWNLLIPGSLMQPGLRLLAEVDPSGAIAETSEADNRYPLSGDSAPVDVRSLPVFSVRFVPVLQQVNGLQGNVTSANTEQFLAEVKTVLPVGAYSAEVRAPYTSSAAVVQSDNGNGAWGTILSEVRAVKTAEGSSRYYYGVVKTSYASGIAGMGYVGGSTRTAVGWDRLPSGAGIMAHEVGHNMGRTHAPCGNVASSDPGYPHAGGKIGVWGLNVATLALKPPTTADLMGYCNPDWVSDYTWSGMIAYRESGAMTAPPAIGGTEGLLIWGRLTDHGIVLEPAFQVPVHPDNLPAPGGHRVELVDGSGQVITASSFTAHQVSDLPGAPEEHFAFVLPVDADLQGRIAEIRVAARGRRASLRAGSGGGAEEVLVTRRSDSRIDLRWDESRFPMVLVRDARSGEVLSFARGGAAVITSQADSLSLQLSDGVRPRARGSRVPLR